MGEVTGRLSQVVVTNEGSRWKVEAPLDSMVCRDRLGRPVPDGSARWFFRRRIDAVAFAARKGIKLQEET